MQEPDDSSQRESKSQRKRDMLALQKIGEILVDLPAAQLAKVPLSETLKDAVDAARSIKSHEGKRRQLQFIGKIMRNVDVEPIQAAIDKIQMKTNLNKTHFHLVERWRDRLIAEGDSLLQEFMDKYPQADSQQMRQLIRNAQKEVKENKLKGGDTALFRYLRDVIDQS